MISDLTGSPSVLLTDLYQLTMPQGYFDQGMEESAVFQVFSVEAGFHKADCYGEESKKETSHVV